MTKHDTTPTATPRRTRAAEPSPEEELFLSTAPMWRYVARRWAWGSQDAEQAAATEVWAAIRDGITDRADLMRAASRGAAAVTRSDVRAHRRTTRLVCRDMITEERCTDFADDVVDAIDAERAIQRLVDTTDFPLDRMRNWADRKAGVVDKSVSTTGTERNFAWRWSNRARAALEGFADAA